MVRSAVALSLSALSAVCAAAQGPVVITSTTPAVTLHPGDSGIPLSVTLGNGSSAGPITVTLSGLPSGITAPSLTLAPGATASFSLAATPAAAQEDFLYNSPTNPNTFTGTIYVVASAGSNSTSAPVSLTVSLSNPSFQPASSQIGLPMLNINTSGAPITSKTTNVSGTLTLTSSSGSKTLFPSSGNTDNTATFHVHGNTTSQLPKLPYTVKLNTSTDLLSLAGLTCPYVTSSGNPVCDKSKSFILLANYTDKTMLRDWAASSLANAIPLASPYLAASSGTPTPSGNATILPWAPHSVFVELYLNGAYQGVYQLIEAVKIDSHRVNIPALTASSTNNPTGGYLMEFNQYSDDDYDFTTPQGLTVGMEDPDFSPEVPEQEHYITSYVDNAENALFSSSFTDPKLGWRAFLDEASTVNFYIVNDLLGNYDGGRMFSSDYFYKTANNPLLYMGPVWDFDTSAGNDYTTPVTDPIIDPTQAWMTQYAPWWHRLFQDPSFYADTAKQWNTLKTNGILTNWLNGIAAEGALLQQDQANNYQRWPMLGIRTWPNSVALGNYPGEVSLLLTWLHLRMGYLDDTFNPNKGQTSTFLTAPSSFRSNIPATFSTVTYGNQVTGTVGLLLDNAVIAGVAMSSDGRSSITVPSLPAGSHYLRAVYSGDNNNFRSDTGTDFQITVAPAAVSTSTSLAFSDTAPAQGQSVTITASVRPTSGSAMPTGSVTLYEGSTALGSSTLDGNGVASTSTTGLPAGTNQYTAVYSGDSNNLSSTSSSVTVTAGGTPSLAGQVTSITGPRNDRSFNLTITNSGTATANNVMISDGDLDQTGGPSCNPSLLVGLPLMLGNFAPGEMRTVSVPVDFSPCAAGVYFYTAATFTANDGVVVGSVPGAVYQP